VQELGGSIARQTTKLASGILPYHKSHVQFTNGGWPGGRNLSLSFLFCEFESSLVWEIELFWAFSLF